MNKVASYEIILVKSKGVTHRVKVDPGTKAGLAKYKKKVSLNSAGYAQISKNKGRWTGLHHCVVGFPQENLVVDHINGDKLDNRLENLRFVTRSVNRLHAQTPIKNWMDLAKAKVGRSRSWFPYGKRKRVAPGVFSNGFGGYEIKIIENTKTVHFGTYPEIAQAEQVYAENMVRLGRYV